MSDQPERRLSIDFSSLASNGPLFIKNKKKKKLYKPIKLPEQLPHFRCDVVIPLPEEKLFDSWVKGYNRITHETVWLLEGEQNRYYYPDKHEMYDHTGRKIHGEYTIHY